MGIRQKSFTDGDKVDDYEINCDEKKCKAGPIEPGKWRDSNGHLPDIFADHEWKFYNNADKQDRPQANDADKHQETRDVLNPRQAREKVIKEHINNKNKP